MGSRIAGSESGHQNCVDRMVLGNSMRISWRDRVFLHIKWANFWLLSLDVSMKELVIGIDDCRFRLYTLATVESLTTCGST